MVNAKVKLSFFALLFFFQVILTAREVIYNRITNNFPPLNTDETLDDSKSCFFRVTTENNSQDGRFIPGIVNYRAEPKRIFLFHVNEEKIVKTFNWNVSGHSSPGIYSYGDSNFKVYNYVEYSYVNAEAIVDTETVPLTMIIDESSSDRTFEMATEPEDDRFTDYHKRNMHPVLMRDLNIVPLAKTAGEFYIAGDNLRLRSGQGLSDAIITTMERGQKVEILETGREETIDGIRSSWVRVELL